MYKQLTISFFLFSLLFSSKSFSDFRCAVDYNGIEGIQSEEMPVCTISDNGTHVCPLQQQVCNIPLVWEERQDGFNYGTCSSDSTFSHECSLDNNTYTSLAVCQASCQEPNMIQVQVPGPPECPLGSSHQCLDVGGTPVCSASPCIDTSNPTVETSEDLPNESQTNNSVDSSGQCTGQYKFFPGTFTTCKLAGYSTRWDNCCNNGNKIITDSFNSPIDQATSTFDAVSGIVDSVVGGSYVPGDTLGTIITADGIASAGAGTLTLSGVFVSAEIATQAANWLVTPCADESPQVAMIASGYCVRTGSYCSESWRWIGCVQRKEKHCCFNSLLGKIMHQQGRPQLGMGWSNCDGFTTEQFQAIDFSKIDLSAYEQEIVRSTDSQIEGITNDASTRAVNKFGP